MPDNEPSPVTVALIEELRRIAAQLTEGDEPAVVFHP